MFRGCRGGLTFGTRFLNDICPFVRIKQLCLEHLSKVRVSVGKKHFNAYFHAKTMSTFSPKDGSHYLILVLSTFRLTSLDFTTYVKVGPTQGYLSGCTPEQP